MLYNIFNEFLGDVNEDVLPNDRTGDQDTLIWQKLFNFQRDAATGSINKVRKTLADEAPWKPINFPSNQEVLSWLDVFPDAAVQGLGMGDLSIKEDWEDLCAKYRMSRVRVSNGSFAL